MNKITRLLVAASMVGLMPVGAAADEGMWTMFNLPEAVYNQMKQEGFTLPYSSLYEADNAIKNCVVNFSGYCSGVVVSPDGLVFTNHHCGFSAINKHSTVEHDYMLNGFYAKSYEEELPNENMFVAFMRSQEDVTERVEAALAGKSADEADMVIDSINNVMNDSVKKIDKTLSVEVQPFYEGNKYYATTYQYFNDLRLVFTVPKSMGKFGGETDNWMWPRQTCDFSVFRIYADPKTNGPANYSKDNVPYHPKSWAPVSLQGYKDKDFSMTVGYPGSTERYLSSYGIESIRNIENSTRIQVRTIKLDILKKYMDADEQTRINYENAYVGSANYWKNSIGMNKCIDSIGIINQKREYEKRIQAFQDSTNYLAHNVDFPLLKHLYEASAPYHKASMYCRESFSGNSELLKRALRLNLGMEVKGPKNNEKKQYMEFEDNSDKWNLALDKELTKAMIRNYREHVDKEFLPAFYTIVDKDFGGNTDKFVDWVYENTNLLKKGYKFYFNKKSFRKDPAVCLGLDIYDIQSAIMQQMRQYYDSIQEQEKYLCAAKLRMEENMPHYSDANFTMRLSYGQVGGYMMGAQPSGYYTDTESILRKMAKGNENADYFAQPIMHDLMAQKDFGRYQDKTTGKLQLCFLTNNDITGGNSGSPMFDGKGRLIGLAFDGNWDALSSDINFDRVLARCIGVDIRYVLYLMDRWGHADRLLKEINPVE